MVAVKARDVENILRKPDPTCRVFLVYGPDAGLVSERVTALIRRLCPDPQDPFSVQRLAAELLADQPSRLYEEGSSPGLFGGGEKLILIRSAGRNVHRAVETVLESERFDARIVIEADDLGRSAPLRTLCEKSVRALAIPCYADQARDLGALLDQALREARVQIEPAARTAFLERIGSDRLVSRGEIEKMILYAGPDGRLTLTDIEALSGDAGAHALNDLVDAAFAGDAASFDRHFTRAMNEGMDSNGILAGFLRHALVLTNYSLDRSGSESSADFIARQRGIHFSRQSFLTRHLDSWSTEALLELTEAIGASILSVRRQPMTARDNAYAQGIRIMQKARVRRRP